MLGADVCILYSDIDGVYDQDPRANAMARHLPLIDHINNEIEAMAAPEAAGGDSTGGSQGSPDPDPNFHPLTKSSGMVTKLQAAKIATGGGCNMAIAHGEKLHPLRRLIEGERCTWFQPRQDTRSARENWIAGAIRVYGTLTLDRGAEKALLNGSSLLSKGVLAQSGTFQKGDPVEMKSEDGRVVGRGLVSYNWQDAYRLLGRDSDEQLGLIGYRGSKELIHRNDMVIGDAQKRGDGETADYHLKLDY